MNISLGQLLGDLAVLVIAAWALTLAWAVWRAPWRKLFQPDNFNVFLGACVLVMVLWKLRAGVSPGLDIHFLGITTLVLMFGWEMAVIASTVILAGLTFFGEGVWSDFPANAFVTGIIPATVTAGVLWLSERFLPRHFFIYVYVGAFFGGALAIVASALFAAGLLWLSGAYSPAQLWREFIAYLPLLALPEGFLNGMIMTGLVVLKPEWVATFSDERYLKGK